MVKQIDKNKKIQVERSPLYLIASKNIKSCTGETIKKLILATLQKFKLSAIQALMCVIDQLCFVLASSLNRLSLICYATSRSRDYSRLLARCKH